LRPKNLAYVWTECLVFIFALMKPGYPILSVLSRLSGVNQLRRWIGKGYVCTTRTSL